MIPFVYPDAHGRFGPMLLYGYTYVLTSGYVGLVRGRAPLGRYVTWIARAAAVALLGLVLCSVVQWAWQAKAPALWNDTLAGVLIGAALLLAGYHAGRSLAAPDPEGRVRRGAVVLQGAAGVRAVRQRRRAFPQALSLAGVPLAPLDETKHCKLIGTTGTGKSTAISGLLTGALARGDRAVFADPNGGYLYRYYDPERGDMILNPFDEASACWDLFAEIRAAYDVDQIALSLIPASGGSDEQWGSYARTLFSAVLRQLWTVGVHDTGELYRLVTTAPRAELATLVAGTPAQPFLEDGNERMFGSIRSVAGNALAPLQYVADQKGTPLSVREWVRSGKGTLFLPYTADQIAALRSLISTWLRLAIFQTLSLPEGDHRLWFVVDELDAIGRIDGLKDALARLRKVGGRCVLGFQSIAQVSTTYGHGDAQTIVENCGNTLILRCSASEQGGTAQFAARLIGQREVARTHQSQARRRGWGSGALSSTTTRSEQRVVEEAVLASEIEQLPDLVGYVRAASSPHWVGVRL